jgi:hypothetical protein
VVADDPVEAGMLALDLVQAGVTAQAVRDAETAVEQLLALGLTSGVVAVVVAAHRDLAQTVALSERLAGLPKPPAFIAVVLRSQRDAAVKHIDDDGWTGVAVRPVNAEDWSGSSTTSPTVTSAPTLKFAAAICKNRASWTCSAGSLSAFRAQAWASPR